MAALILEPAPSFAPSYTHATVMRDEVVRALDPQPYQTLVDCTVGGGGHAEAWLEAASHTRLVAFDRDPAALSASRARLARFGERCTFVHGSFGTLAERLPALGVDPVDAVLADLGLSSAQLDDPGRGLSFRAEGPLDMRMDPDDAETARELIGRLTQDELADVIYELGEEKRSRRIASCIKQAYRAGELATTLDLRRAIVRAVGPRRVGGIDPATRTFQALRIAVNRELDELATLLARAPEVLRPGGTAVCISFHSLEDRLVKRAFLQREQWVRVTPKPLLPSDAELERNPRARSAKLRIARRL